MSIDNPGGSLTRRGFLKLVAGLPAMYVALNPTVAALAQHANTNVGNDAGNESINAMPGLFINYNINPYKIIEGINSGLISSIFIGDEEAERQAGFEWTTIGQLPKFINENSSIIDFLFLGKPLNPRDQAAFNAATQIQAVAEHMIDEVLGEHVEYETSVPRLFQRVYYTKEKKIEQIVFAVDIKTTKYDDFYTITFKWDKDANAVAVYFYQINLKYPDSRYDIRLPVDENIYSPSLTPLMGMEGIYSSTGMNQITELIEE